MLVCQAFLGPTHSENVPIFLVWALYRSSLNGGYVCIRHEPAPGKGRIFPKLTSQKTASFICQSCCSRTPSTRLASSRNSHPQFPRSPFAYSTHLVIKRNGLICILRFTEAKCVHRCLRFCFEIFFASSVTVSAREAYVDLSNHFLSLVPSGINVIDVLE